MLKLKRMIELKLHYLFSSLQLTMFFLLNLKPPTIDNMEPYLPTYLDNHRLLR